MSVLPEYLELLLLLLKSPTPESLSDTESEQLVVVVPVVELLEAESGLLVDAAVDFSDKSFTRFGASAMARLLPGIGVVTKGRGWNGGGGRLQGLVLLRGRASSASPVVAGITIFSATTATSSLDLPFKSGRPREWNRTGSMLCRRPNSFELAWK